MLNKPIQGFTFDDKGRVTGVKSEGEVAKCNAVIGDPTYFTDKVSFKYHFFCYRNLLFLRSLTNDS